MHHRDAQAGLHLYCKQTPKDRFSCAMAQMMAEYMIYVTLECIIVRAQLNTSEQQGCKFHSPAHFASKMLCRASKCFYNLCSTFIINSISEKNLGHEGE